MLGGQQQKVRPMGEGQKKGKAKHGRHTCLFTLWGSGSGRSGRGKAKAKMYIHLRNHLVVMVVVGHSNNNAGNLNLVFFLTSAMDLL